MQREELNTDQMIQAVLDIVRSGSDAEVRGGADQDHFVVLEVRKRKVLAEKRKKAASERLVPLSLGQIAERTTDRRIDVSGKDVKIRMHGQTITATGKAAGNKQT